MGVHGYDETRSVDLNEAPVGVGWNPNSPTQTIFGQPAKTSCLGVTLAAPIAPTQSSTTNCAGDAAAESAARPYNAKFPYFAYIGQTTSGFISNYSGLQATLDGRNYHGLSFLTAYTYSHALDDWTKNSQATSALADPARPQYQYGNSDLDIRHRLRFSPTYAIPGRMSPCQMLEGWQISGIWAFKRLCRAPNDPSTDDWGGNGENAITARRDQTTELGRAGTTPVRIPPSTAMVTFPFPVMGRHPAVRRGPLRRRRYGIPAAVPTSSLLNYAVERPRAGGAHQSQWRLLHPERRNFDTSRLWNSG